MLPLVMDKGVNIFESRHFLKVLYNLADKRNILNYG